MKENGIKYFTIANYGRDWKSLLERQWLCEGNWKRKVLSKRETKGVLTVLTPRGYLSILIKYKGGLCLVENWKAC